MATDSEPQDAHDELREALDWFKAVAGSSAPLLGEAVARLHRARARVEAMGGGAKGGGSP